MSERVPEVLLRPKTVADEPFLLALYCGVHAPAFEGLTLPPGALEELLRMQFRAQSNAYATRFPNAVDRIVQVDDQPVGRVLVDREPAALHLVDLELIPECHGRGIGGWILRQVTAEADVHRLALHLQVRVGSRARKLYERHGFVEVSSDDMNVSMRRAAMGEAD